MAAATARNAAALLAVGGGSYFAGQYLARRTVGMPPPTSDHREPQQKNYLIGTEPNKNSLDFPVDEKFAYWRDRWLNKMLGWHLENPHPVLMTHLNDWLGDDGETQRSILFPLCGASVDLGCIARRGHQVVGVEAVPEAIDRLLSEYGEEIEGGRPPDARLWLRVGQPNWMQKVAAEQLSKSEKRSMTYQPAPFLFAVQGDFLAFDRPAASQWGFPEFDCAFDRGGLVAVAPSDRHRYAAVLSEQLRPGGKLLLVVVEHEPAFGPPHSVDESEVRRLLGSAFEIQKLSVVDEKDKEPWKARGVKRFDEVAYMCTRKGGALPAE